MLSWSIAVAGSQPCAASTSECMKNNGEPNPCARLTAFRYLEEYCGSFIWSKAHRNLMYVLALSWSLPARLINVTHPVIDSSNAVVVHCVEEYRISSRTIDDIWSGCPHFYGRHEWMLCCTRSRSQCLMSCLHSVTERWILWSRLVLAHNDLACSISNDTPKWT